jgi:hypothetical protein
MPTRAEILDTLAASQTQVLAFFHNLGPEDLERPATANGVPGAAPWQAKDHFAHLAQNERNLQHVLRRIHAGETEMQDNLDALTPEEEERLTIAVASFNQTIVNAHHNDTLEMISADFLAARQETVDLLQEFTDDQLAAPMPPQPSGDRSAGELFASHARHAAEHMTLIEEGWREARVGTM